MPDWYGTDVIAWTLVVWATASAVFRGYFRPWLLTYGDMSAQDKARAANLHWEIQRGRRWTRQEAEGGAPVPGSELSHDEIEARRKELAALMRLPLPRQLARYLAACVLCQHFWAALAWSIAAVDVSLAYRIAWTLAVAAAATILETGLAAVAALLPQQAPYGQQHGMRTGCPGCGGHRTAASAAQQDQPA